MVAGVYSARFLRRFRHLLGPVHRTLPVVWIDAVIALDHWVGISSWNGRWNLALHKLPLLSWARGAEIVGSRLLQLNYSRLGLVARYFLLKDWQFFDRIWILAGVFFLNEVKVLGSDVFAVPFAERKLD